MWPHRQQPTRVPCPWDSLGKNNGVGCHFLLQCMKVKSESEVAQSWPTLHDPMDCSLPGRLLHPWDFPDKSTGVGCHCLLRFNTWGLHNPVPNLLSWLIQACPDTAAHENASSEWPTRQWPLVRLLSYTGLSTAYQLHLFRAQFQTRTPWSYYRKPYAESWF